MKANNTKLVSKICRVIEVSFIVTIAVIYSLLFVSCPTKDEATAIYQSSTTAVSKEL